jgi:hypothetical protein
MPSNTAAADDADEGRLAGAITSEHTEFLATGQIEGDTIQNAAAAVLDGIVLGDVDAADHGWRAGSTLPMTLFL